MSVVPPLPMLALSLIFEGPHRIGASLASSLQPAALPAWLGLAYTVLIGTIVGSGLWVWLLSRHPAGRVAPFSLLVPVTGLTAAWLVLGETPRPLELLGGVAVIGGVLWASLRRSPTVAPAPALDQPEAETALPLSLSSEMPMTSSSWPATQDLGSTSPS
jgi:O-acetylserine/cysteine efflux transporter